MPTLQKIAMLSFLLVAGCSHRLRWASIQVADGPASESVIVKKFDSLDVCQADPSSKGGYCGQDCPQEAPGLVAQCKQTRQGFAFAVGRV
jgi:hypothetical protein